MAKYVYDRVKGCMVNKDTLAPLETPRELPTGFAGPQISSDYAPYTCPITGQWVEGKREHEANLRKHGCRVLEKGEKEEFMRDKKRQERDRNREIEKTVAQAASEAGLPA